MDDILDMFRIEASTVCATPPQSIAARRAQVRQRYDEAAPYTSYSLGPVPGMRRAAVDGDKNDVAREAAFRAYLRGEIDNAVVFAEWGVAAVLATGPSSQYALPNRYSEIAFYQAHAGDFVLANQALSAARRVPMPAATAPARYAAVYRAALEARAAAAMLRARGDIATAEAESRRAVEQMDIAHRLMEAGPVRQPSLTGLLAIAEAELADTLARGGRLLEAEAWARRAIGRRPTYGPDTALLQASLLLRLAEILFEQGRWADVETLAGLVVSIHRRECASLASLANAVAHDLLARSLLVRGRASEALLTYRTLAANLREDARVLDLKFGGSSMWALAELLAGDLHNADRRLDLALKRAAGLLPANHYNLAELEGLRALAFLRQGDRARALQLFERAVPKLMKEANVAEQEVVDGGARRWRLRIILEGYLEFLDDMRLQPQPSGRRDLDGEAFQVMQIMAAGKVARALAAAGARGAAGDTALAEMIRLDQDAGRRIAALQTTVALVATSTDNRGGTSAAQAREALTAMRLARQSLREQLDRRFPAYASLVNPGPVAVPDVQAVLAPGEALVAIYTGAARTHVWAIPRMGPVSVATVPLAAHAVAKIVATLRLQVTDPPVSAAGIPGFDVAAAHRLYLDLLGPVEPGWRPARSLIVVTNDPLDQLPLSLLVTQPHGELRQGRIPFQEYRDVLWLARTHALAAVPSVASLIALRTVTPSRADRLPFIGFGDPLFRPDTAFGSTASADATALADAHDVRRRRSLPDTRRLTRANLGALPRLPETAEELHAIAKALGGDPARDVLTGAQASETEVKGQDLRRRRVIAFATHGLVPGDLDGLTEPALALSPPITAGTEDGLLTLGEILELKLDADWVVLSACNTAAADGAGSEAVSGLGRAFFYAGARALLVTHWAVYSQPTRDLMVEVFRAYAQDPRTARSEHLRRAMLLLIDAVGNSEASGPISYAHPVFWAPFALVGDPG